MEKEGDQQYEAPGLKATGTQRPKNFLFPLRHPLVPSYPLSLPPALVPGEGW